MSLFLMTQSVDVVNWLPRWQHRRTKCHKYTL